MRSRVPWPLGAVVLAGCVSGSAPDAPAETGTGTSTTPSASDASSTTTLTSTASTSDMVASSSGGASEPTTSGGSSGDAVYWAPRAPMLTPRSETAAAVIGDRIYVPGGYGGRSALEAYDPKADAWAPLASMPQGRDHAAVAALDGILYVAGGNEGETSLFAYDPGTDLWELRRKLPHARTSAVALAHAGSLWLTGGTSDTATVDELRAVLRYDPVSNTWTTQAPLIHKREHHGAVVADERLWVFGGRDGQLSDDSLEIYDPVDGSAWAGPSMAVGRGGFQAVFLDGRILAHAGERHDDGPAFVVGAEALDLGARAWSETLEVPVPVHGHAAVAHDGVLFVIGGSDMAGGIANMGRVWSLDP